ncbi:zinc finger protein 664 [Colletotrichum orchidophilum]|uniref:Zinc finger protein 664 n=1 Tax=Colletotrichum orchidophilum TaxID=1209926 RepID=A0A1G4BKY2_9PEZI|nr:zinc finger protein 664 [Colletotrichum orchidophilum]OHF02102.1 zinc finger protein 664 [Colletotrichum orchidophilum]
MDFSEEEIPLLKDENVWYGFYFCTWPGCEDFFPTPGARRKHYRAHYRPVICPVCEKRMAWNRDMRKHFETHFKRPRFQCRCTKDYSKMDNLKKHMKKMNLRSMNLRSIL